MCPSQAITTCHHPHAETAELLDAVFSTSWTEVKTCLIMTSVWLPGVVSKFPHRGQRPHPEATIPKRGGGLWGSQLAWMWEGGQISCAHKRGGRSPRPCGVGGEREIQVKCRWWLSVALLIERGVPQVAEDDWKGRTPSCLSDWKGRAPSLEVWWFFLLLQSK